MKNVLPVNNIDESRTPVPDSPKSFHPTLLKIIAPLALALSTAVQADNTIRVGPQYNIRVPSSQNQQVQKPHFDVSAHGSYNGANTAENGVYGSGVTIGGTTRVQINTGGNSTSGSGASINNGAIINQQ
ncbi:MAG: hypothetical protein WCJ84_01495 [Candidatus Peregrinibacteria bacterium]